MVLYRFHIVECKITERYDTTYNKKERRRRNETKRKCRNTKFTGRLFHDTYNIYV